MQDHPLVGRAVEFFRDELGLLAKEAAGSSGSPSALRVEDLPDVLQMAEVRVPFIVEGLIPEGAITIFTGEPGCGKSSLVTSLLGHIAHGVPFAGLVVQRRACLLLDRENPASAVAARLRWLGIPGGIHTWGQWCAEEAPDPNGAAVLEWVQRTQPKPVIVIDSAIAFLGGDENSSADVRAFLHRCRKLAAAGCTLLVIHHSGKGETSKQFRGSMDWKGGCDVMLVAENLSTDPNVLDRVRLMACKRRVPVESPLLLEWNSDETQWIRRDTSPLEDSGEIMTRVLRTHPGVSKRKLADLAAPKGVSRNRAFSWVDGGLLDGTIRQTKSRGGTQLFLTVEGVSD